jgi:hypothetical protein
MHGHVAFVRAALQAIDTHKMKPDVQVYEQLLTVFPVENT